MTEAKNRDAIISAVAKAKAYLDKEMGEFENHLEKESTKQITKARNKLLDALEDSETLSPKDAKQKMKRDYWMQAKATAVGALVGVGVAVLFTPITLAVAAFMGTSLSMIVTSAIAGTLITAASTAIGYGVGFVNTKLTPYIPKLSREQMSDIKEKAQDTVHTDIIGKLLCQLRLERTEGHINHKEYSEIVDTGSDLALLQYKIPESAVEKLKLSAQEARAIGKDEREESREEDKLKLEKTKTEKEEKRNEKKEDIALQKLEQDMKLDKITTIAKVKKMRDGGGGLQDLAQVFSGLFSGQNGMEMA